MDQRRLIPSSLDWFPVPASIDFAPLVENHQLTIMSQSSGKVKAGQLWSKNKDDLTKQLGELKTELGQLRIQKIVSSGTKLNKMYVFFWEPSGRR